MQNKSWIVPTILLGVFILAAVLLLATGTVSFKNSEVDTNIIGYREVPVEESGIGNTGFKMVTKLEDEVVYVDLRNGDRNMYAVTVVRPVSGKGDLLIVITEPGEAMDITYEAMIFSSYMLEGTQAEVLEFTSKIEGFENAVKVYIGSETPRGFVTVDKASGWWDSLTTRAYSTDEEDIDAGEGVPSFIPAKATLEMRTIQPATGQADYGQFWITSQPGQVVHYVVVGGYKLVIRQGYQGTNFHYQTMAPNFWDNVIQKTGYVVEQDHVWEVNLFLCGPTTSTDTVLDSTYVTNTGVTVPVHADWQTELSGWSCEKTGE